MTQASIGKTHLKIQLNPNIKILWSLKYIAAFIITFLMFYAFEAVTGGWDAFISDFMLQLAFVAIIATFVFFYYIEMKYKGYYYMLTETELVFRKGIINTIKTVVPFKEIQNLNIEKNALERMLGIANLRIETAGSNITESEIMLPGVENADDLSDMIRRKMEDMKAGKPTPESCEAISFEHVDKAQNNKIEGLEKRITGLETKLDDLARSEERRGNEIETVMESVDTVHTEMKLVHSSIAKLMHASEETSGSMDKIGKLMAKIATNAKAKPRKK
jgi:membrane protein YdbS with pleckstrin-like domain